eukprot:CAMPEP_0170632432 /NCGR_PEP_ID=MMETSP0224-20130122/35321_1 /TAXON_ID=285029 /ORGANISM="Togula jolla, Strain CCCM 725" /LENGTH=115 /DNA_ID=CAMNT_0010961137 /DNA_START=114 /DNA_END=458 /DNA_ORIENTATION=+
MCFSSLLFSSGLGGSESSHLTTKSSSSRHQELNAAVASNGPSERSMKQTLAKFPSEEIVPPLSSSNMPFASSSQKRKRKPTCCEWWRSSLNRCGSSLLCSSRTGGHGPLTSSASA